MSYSITDKVRKEIPNILKDHKGGLNFNELFSLLKEKFGKELIDANGNDRTGVLRGIVNKLDSIPIENVTAEKRGNNTFYRYIASELDELILISKIFIKEIDKKGLLKVNMLSLNVEEQEKYKKYQSLVLDLNNLNNKQN